MNHFETLNKINVNDKVEKKNNLSYLAWAFAWAEVKKIYPDANYNIKKFENYLPYVFDKKTGYMVFTDMTIEGLTHEMWLPVMDGANKAMKDEPYKYATKYGEKTCDAADMFDINKTIMRCLVKNLAMFGLGLYIYAGEDLPEDEEQKPPVKPHEPAKVNVTVTPEELSRRLVEISNIQKTLNVTAKDMKRVSEEMGSPTVKNMTSSEYEDFLIDLRNRLTVA